LTRNIIITILTGKKDPQCLILHFC